MERTVSVDDHARNQRTRLSDAHGPGGSCVPHVATNHGHGTECIEILLGETPIGHRGSELDRKRLGEIFGGSVRRRSTRTRCPPNEPQGLPWHGSPGPSLAASTPIITAGRGYDKRSRTATVAPASPPSGDTVVMERFSKPRSQVQHWRATFTQMPVEPARIRSGTALSLASQREILSE